MRWQLLRRGVVWIEVVHFNELATEMWMESILIEPELAMPRHWLS